MKLRGIPGSKTLVAAPLARAVAMRPTRGARLPPAAIEKPAGERWDYEGGQLPEPAKKA